MLLYKFGVDVGAVREPPNVVADFKNQVLSVHFQGIKTPC